MAGLGLWTPFIDEEEMSSWYSLPARLAQEHRAYRPDGHEMAALAADSCAELHRRTVAYARQSVAPFRPAYHNDSVHFADTEARGLAAADAYAAGNNRKMPTLVRQVFGLALRTHDAHHCASTFRVDAQRGVYNATLGLHVATEWVTADAVNTFMRQNGLNLPARLFQTGVIWSSTYGGQTPKGQSLGIPDPKPRTIWGAIMRAADACPPDSFTQWLKQGIAVNYGEIPAVPAATTLEGFIASNRGFLGYVEHCLNRMDAIARMPLSETLGWRERVATMKRGMDHIERGNRHLLGVICTRSSVNTVQPSAKVRGRLGSFLGGPQTYNFSGTIMSLSSCWSICFSSTFSPMYRMKISFQRLSLK